MVYDDLGENIHDTMVTPSFQPLVGIPVKTPNEDGTTLSAVHRVPVFLHISFCIVRNYDLLYVLYTKKIYNNVAIILSQISRKRCFQENMLFQNRTNLSRCNQTGYARNNIPTSSLHLSNNARNIRPRNLTATFDNLNGIYF